MRLVKREITWENLNICKFVHPNTLSNSSVCDGDEYECADGNCIELGRKCDGQRDCTEGEDEDECGVGGE